MNLLVALLVAALTGVAALLWRSQAARRRTTARLDELIGARAPGQAPAAGTGTEPERAPAPGYPSRYRWLPPASGSAIALGLWLAVELPWEVSLAFGLLATVIGHLGEEALASVRTTRIETQLSEAIDMLVASLRAGAAVLAGFEATLRDARMPLKPYVEEVVGRVRLGEDPRRVILSLADQVPLETFRLFAMSLAIHWEVGGSLASTLATVGRTIRDRIELDRRVRAQGIEAHASVAAVMGITYLLAYLMWRSNPDRVGAFVRSDAGTQLTAIVIGLQAVGLLWMSRISRSSF